MTTSRMQGPYTCTWTRDILTYFNGISRYFHNENIAYWQIFLTWITKSPMCRWRWKLTTSVEKEPGNIFWWINEECQFSNSFTLAPERRLVARGSGDQVKLWELHVAAMLVVIGVTTSAANWLIGEVVQSRRGPLLGPSPGWKHLLALSHLRHC